MKQITQLFLVGTLSLLIGCGGSSRPGSPVVFFGGLWLVDYTSVLDECGLLAEGISDFLDTHEIKQEEESVEVTTQSLPTETYTGTTRTNNSFLTSALLEGDLFGDGSFCELIEDLSYNDATEDSAQTLYRVRLQCSDGFSCDSVVRGFATKE